MLRIYLSQPWYNLSDDGVSLQTPKKKPKELSALEHPLHAIQSLPRFLAALKGTGGPRRDRTAGLVIANDALYQLSYGPVHKDNYL